MGVGTIQMLRVVGLGLRCLPSQKSQPALVGWLFFAQKGLLCDFSLTPVGVFLQFSRRHHQTTRSISEVCDMRNNESRASQDSQALPNALRSFDQLPDTAHVRQAVVKALFGCSDATVWRRVRDGGIPRPHKLSARVTAWNVGELRSALATLKGLASPGSCSHHPSSVSSELSAMRSAPRDRNSAKLITEYAGMGSKGGRASVKKDGEK